jgi:hypothetical protein
MFSGNIVIWLWIIPVIVLLAVALSWRRLRFFGREVQAERAQELFALQRERLELKFMNAAAASGKPRGLLWKNCDWDGPVAFARERRTGHLAALAGVTIQFEAAPGSDMEGLPAVGTLRDASAVFFFHRGQWHTVGKTIFNMNPAMAIEHFKNQYEPVKNSREGHPQSG